MSFRFRTATISDIPAIRALIAASVRALQIEYSESEREAAIATVFTVDSRLIEDGTYLLAFATDGRLAGCGGWSRRKTLFGGDQQLGSIEPELLNPTLDAAKIRAIFVRPEFARQGLGSAILAASELSANGEGYTRFEMASTLSGLALYRLKGYLDLERRVVPVGNGEQIHVVRMIKSMTPD